MSTTAHNAKVMNRFELTKRLVGKLKRDEAVIGGIGNTNFDLWAAGQRPHARNAASLQHQRHTGAGRFVRSSAEKDQFTVNGNFPVPVFKFF